MAEVTALRNLALPYPVYGAPWAVVRDLVDADGDLVTAAADLDSELSLNGNTYADATNEATEIATDSGTYYLLLTAAEMTADIVAGIIKTSTVGAKTAHFVLNPRKLVTLRAGTSAGGAVGYITLDAGASAEDDFYNGCVCIATIDTNVEARVISDYTGSNKQAVVVPDWNVAPDADDTFIVKLPEGVQINQANLTHWLGTAAATPSVAGVPEVDVTHWLGTAAATPSVAGVPEVDVTHWLGTAAATPSVGGVPEVDLTHVAGVAADATAAQLGVNVVAISEDETAADNLEKAADGTGYNLGGGSIVAASVTGEVTADAVKISGSAPAADNLEASALGVVRSTAVTGTLTATAFTTSLTEATSDHYNGRVVVFTAGVLAGQAKAVLDYDGSTKILTTRAFTEAPANGDAFVLV